MSEQAIAAIREMLQPGTTLQVTDSQIPQVPVGRKQIVVSIEDHGVMTKITEGLPEGAKDSWSFVPIGGGCGPTDAEQLLGGTFVLWDQSFPETSRITYKVVDTVYQAITQGPDGYWSVLAEGEDFSALTGLTFDTVTAPGAREQYRDWQILPKLHIQTHPDQYPFRSEETNSAPTS